MNPNQPKPTARETALETELEECRRLYRVLMHKFESQRERADEGKAMLSADQPPN